MASFAGVTSFDWQSLSSTTSNTTNLVVEPSAWGRYCRCADLVASAWLLLLTEPQAARPCRSREPLKPSQGDPDEALHSVCCGFASSRASQQTKAGIDVERRPRAKLAQGPAQACSAKGFQSGSCTSTTSEACLNGLSCAHRFSEASNSNATSNTTAVLLTAATSPMIPSLRAIAAAQAVKKTSACAPKFRNACAPVERCESGQGWNVAKSVLLSQFRRVHGAVKHDHGSCSSPKCPLCTLNDNKR